MLLMIRLYSVFEIEIFCLLSKEKKEKKSNTDITKLVIIKLLNFFKLKFNSLR